MQIQLKEITKKFGKKMILHNITMTVPSGKIVGLVGPNGVGKTTLMRIMCHLDTDYSGNVFFDQQSNRNQKVFEDIAFMQDNTVLYPQLTGYQHLAFLASIHQTPKSRIDEVIKMIGIESYCHQKTGTYSLGMKQHLLIAMAIFSDPACLILDEPYNGLDPSSTIRLKEWLRKWSQQGKTIVLSSHNLNLISDLTPYVYFLKDAKLTSFTLDDSTRWRYYLTTNDNTLFKKKLDANNLIYQLESNIFLIDGDLKPYLDILYQNELHLLHLEPAQLSLEEVYRDLYE